MSFSSGVFTLAAGNPVVTGTTISSTWANNTLSDIATGLSTCVLKDGTQTITANIPMATFKLTGLGAGSVAGDSIRYEQVFTTSTVSLLGGIAIAGALNEFHGADIASAATVNLTTATGNVVDVTGTVTITAITLAEGYQRWVRFTGALTLTNGASLVLPSAANITTAAGDYALFIGYAAGVVRCAAYLRLDGTAVTTAPFLDSVALVKGSSDATKLIRFEVDGNTTGTTRVYTPPNYDCNLGLTSGTPTATTSGTAINFTGIPAFAKRIIVQFVGVSTTGTSIPMVQIGPSGGIETTGYLCSAITAGGGGNNGSNGTTGFITGGTHTSAYTLHGTMTLTLENASSNTWAASWSFGNSEAALGHFGGGSKPVAAVVDRIRLTTVGGTDTFDAGAVNIIYE